MESLVSIILPTLELIIGCIEVCFRYYFRLKEAIIMARILCDHNVLILLTLLTPWISRHSIFNKCYAVCMLSPAYIQAHQNAL